MSGSGSVTVWLDRLKAGDQDQAVTELWHRYFEKLVSRARDHIRGRRVAADGEDIALSAFHRFVRAVGEGRFPRMNNRNDLWQVLLVLTARSATNAARDEARQKRGGGVVVQPMTPPGDSGGSGLPVPSSDPDPAEVVDVAERVERMLEALKDPQLRQIAILALEGYTNEEIAEQIGRVEATVERKLKRIREIWTEQGMA